MPPLSVWSEGLGLQHLSGPADPEVTGVTADSRRVVAGDLFVALRGRAGDGTDHVADAVARGAAAVLLEAGATIDLSEAPSLGVFRSEHARADLAKIARARHQAPDRDLTMVAVTGTNGKTTVSWLGAQLLEIWGQAAGCLGTIRYRTGIRDEAAGWTTPPAEHFYALLDEMRQAERHACVFEASSHAMDQHRVEGCEVDVAVFTNLTREHLEYHRDLDEYRGAKLRLVELLRAQPRSKPRGVAVVNGDDPQWRTVEWPASTIFVGRREGCRVRLRSAEIGPDGLRMALDFDGRDVDVESRLLGDYNVENLLLLGGMALALGHRAEEFVAAVPRLTSVPGRLERVDLGPGAPLVLIDYAHTPDALSSVTGSLSRLGAGRLHVVFGCGGDRDRGKRPVMARAAAEGADFAYLTLDNPRTEDPAQIFSDARAGFAGHEDHSWVIEDREEALATALRRCQEQDVLLVAGKGHETYQILGEAKVDWDDREVLRRAWATLGRERT